MRKNKLKLKKILFGLGTIALVVAPALSVVACSSQKSTNSNKDRAENPAWANTSTNMDDMTANINPSMANTNPPMANISTNMDDIMAYINPSMANMSVNASMLTSSNAFNMEKTFASANDKAYGVGRVSFPTKLSFQNKANLKLYFKIMKATCMGGVVVHHDKNGGGSINVYIGIHHSRQFLQHNGIGQKGIPPQFKKDINIQNIESTIDSTLGLTSLSQSKVGIRAMNINNILKDPIAPASTVNNQNLIQLHFDLTKTGINLANQQVAAGALNTLTNVINNAFDPSMATIVADGMSDISVPSSGVTAADTLNMVTKFASANRPLYGIGRTTVPTKLNQFNKDKLASFLWLMKKTTYGGIVVNHNGNKGGSVDVYIGIHQSRRFLQNNGIGQKGIPPQFNKDINVKNISSTINESLLAAGFNKGSVSISSININEILRSAVAPVVNNQNVVKLHFDLTKSGVNLDNRSQVSVILNFLSNAINRSFVYN